MTVQSRNTGVLDDITMSTMARIRRIPFYCCFVLQVMTFKASPSTAFVVSPRSCVRSLLVSPRVSMEITLPSPSALRSENSNSDFYSDYNPSDYKYVERETYRQPASDGRREGGLRPGGNRRDDGDRGRGRGSFESGGRGRGGSRFSGGGRRDGDGGRGGRGGRSSSRSGSSSPSQRYVRDTSRDNSNVDEEAVEKLIQRRNDARRNRQFDMADQIKDQLLAEHGVAMMDRDNMWRSGASASGSGMKGGFPSRSGDRRNSRDGDRNGGGRGGMSPRPPRDFGPTGHDYSPAPDMSDFETDLSEPHIHEMIAQRLQYKMNRDFAEADAMQAALESENVFVHDGLKQWRADGKRFGDTRGDGGGHGRDDRRTGGAAGRTLGSRADRESQMSYTQSPYSLATESLSPMDLSQIQQLVEDRFEAKKTRHFVTADTIRDQLRVQYNVRVDDKLRQWSVGGEFGPEASNSDRAYVQSPVSWQLDDPADFDVISDAVNQRADAKRKRDFDLADSIRDDLATRYNVDVNDRLRQWSVGGDFDEENGRRFGGESNNRALDRPYERQGRGGMDLSEDDIATIESLVAERADAKKNRDFDTADDIRDELKLQFGVTVDDKKREWRVLTQEYTRSMSRRGGQVVDGDDDEIDAKTMEYIQSRLLVRQQAKDREDYDTADGIRDELGSEYNVSIDDRTREWKIETARTSGRGRASNWDSSIEDDNDEDYNDRNYTIIDSDANTGYAVVEDEEQVSDVNVDSTSSKHVSADVQDTASSIDGEREGGDNGKANGSHDLESLTVPQLKEKLREKGLPVSGVKSVLIDRLLAIET